MPYAKYVDKPDNPSINDSFSALLSAYVKTMKDDKKKNCKANLSRMDCSVLKDEWANLSVQELDKKVAYWIDKFKEKGIEFIDTNNKAIGDRHGLRTFNGMPINTGKEAISAIYKSKCKSTEDTQAVLDHFTFCIDEESTLLRMANYIANSLGVAHTVGLQKFVKKLCHLSLKDSVRKK